jgi:hypothetical protein
MKMAVFWDIAPCSLVYTGRRFRGDFCMIFAFVAIALMMKSVSSSETSVNIYQTKLSKAVPLRHTGAKGEIK